MPSFVSWRSTGAALVALGTLAGAATPLVYTMPAAARRQVSFSDIDANYWAYPFIQRLATEDIIGGFPDGSFRPNQPVTRAQFAVILQRAFNRPAIYAPRTFSDVPTNYWAYEAIQNAYRTGFLSVYANGQFLPDYGILREQALVSLANGLNLNATGSISNTLNAYRDQGQISDYALAPIAAATERRLVVNYPNVDLLNPNQVITRAEVAAFVYQAMVAEGQAPQIAVNSTANNYIAGYNNASYGNAGYGNAGYGNGSSQNSSLLVNSGAILNLRYPRSARNSGDIVVAPGQTLVMALEVADPIRNDRGQTLIPVGSTVQGRIVPVNIQGTDVHAAKFVADRLTVGNQSYEIQAESDPVAAREDVNHGDLQGSLTTAAAQTILGNILGDRNL
ncbi:MAG: S-layer homology domain-containing protein, partial [Leptolyngbyaceae cyanobacterium MO_188.B28]|nr:S-layer homology domain-containing protein [Leptolyngbyaceae cyanobacterium MO_188.B28]